MSLSARALVRRGTFELDVDLEVPDGQVVAVLGPNGAGKSTLLRALAGLAPLDDGALHLGGRPLDVPGDRVWVPATERRVGVVFQDYRLFAHLSTRDNVAFGPRSTGTPRAVARARAQEWLARLGLGEVGDRGPGELSGGQAQRVALARALATGPDLLLLDEPLAALDPATRAGVRRELRRELAAFAGPVLLVTHELLDALLLADRVLVLQAGRVVQDGTPAEVTARPRTSYIAGVVGLNLLRGTAARGRIALDDGRGVGELPLPDAALCGPVLAAVRPAAVHLRAPAPEEAARREERSVTWRARVAAVEGLPDRVRVHLEGGPCPLADVDLPTAAALGLHEGASLTVEVAAADVVAYPALDPG